MMALPAMNSHVLCFHWRAVPFIYKFQENVSQLNNIFSVAEKWYRHFAMDASRSVSLQISLMTAFAIPYFLYSKAGLRRFEGDLGGTTRSNIIPCTVSWRRGWGGVWASFKIVGLSKHLTTVIASCFWCPWWIVIKMEIGYCC